MRLPRTRTAQSGFRAEVVDSIVDGAYRDMNAIEQKIDGLIRSGLTNTMQSSLTFGATQVRHGLVVITAGENTINFGEKVPTSGYRLLTEAYTSDGSAIELDVPPSGKSLSSFKVTAAVAGILNYLIFALPSKKSPERLPPILTR